MASAEVRGRPVAEGAEPVAGGPERGSRQAGVTSEASRADNGDDGAAPGGEGGADEVEEPGEQAEMVVRDAISAPDIDGRPRRATRRFPLFTRDTARPEGGGRAAPRDAPAPARQWPVLTVLAVVGLGLLLTALDQFRYGTLFVGLALLGGAVLRWLLPDVGMLAVRSRFTDIATYGVLGTVIVLLAMMVQPHPWLEIPFLKDTLHFTVSNS
ncbi:DUF3017 domain-containing protein [Streptomyces sp. NPDC091972]|uniref:DUF3017 domain-containing protein n=1 Tax=Streptomyces sp. NPDC091972 TaxID=3366007 RepID=UPI003821DB4F